MLEVNIAVICACLTTIRPLLAPLFPWIFSIPSSPPEAGPEVVTIGRANQRGGLGHLDDTTDENDDHEPSAGVARHSCYYKELSTTTESQLSTSEQSTSTT